MNIMVRCSIVKVNPLPADTHGTWIDLKQCPGHLIRGTRPMRKMGWDIAGSSDAVTASSGSHEPDRTWHSDDRRTFPQAWNPPENPDDKGSRRSQSRQFPLVIDSDRLVWEVSGNHHGNHRKVRERCFFDRKTTPEIRILKSQSCPEPNGTRDQTAGAKGSWPDWFWTGLWLQDISDQVIRAYPSGNPEEPYLLAIELQGLQNLQRGLQSSVNLRQKRSNWSILTELNRDEYFVRGSDKRRPNAFRMSLIPWMEQQVGVPPMAKAQPFRYRIKILNHDCRWLCSMIHPVIGILFDQSQYIWNPIKLSHNLSARHQRNTLPSIDLLLPVSPSKNQQLIILKMTQDIIITLTGRISLHSILPAHHRKAQQVFGKPSFTAPLSRTLTWVLKDKLEKLN